ncbi:MAG: FtsX-like permease family protein [Candidatus Eisenbacteria bacterium]|nr:FtsX-like permease family protein [Candidatus Eisenbacteria bacterium]
MNILESLQAGFRDMASHKGRATITMIGVVLGVASVVAVLALMRGGEEQSLAFWEELGGLRELRITNTRIDRLMMSAAEKASERLTYRDAIAIREECPSVSYVDPEITRWLNVSYGDLTYRMKVLGTTGHYPYADDMPVEEGRFLCDKDVETHANVVAMGPTFKEDLFGEEEAIGKTILIEGVPFRVIGVMERKEFYFEGDGPGNDRNVLEWFNRSHYIPISTMVKRFSITDRLDGLEVAARTVEDVPALTEQVRTVLTRRHGVEDFNIDAKTDRIEQQAEQMVFFNIVFWAIAFVSLFVGGVVIANIMLASITERVREIGVRKAIGGSDRDVFLQFLVEAIVVTVLGGAVGLLLGIGMVGAIDRFLDMPTAVAPSILLVAFLCAVGVGLVFGIFPAIRAARLSPVEALRYE